MNRATGRVFGEQPQPNPVKSVAARPPRVLTAEDVARFLPARGILHTEPKGWAVVGVPANFWVDVEPMTAEGEVLGWPVRVRFAPASYEWRFGDGKTRTSTTSGGPWSQLGQEELTETSTSHVYTDRGAKSAVVAVRYRADFSIDGGEWTAVDGTVSADAPPQPVQVVTERTVLTP